MYSSGLTSPFSAGFNRFFRIRFLCLRFRCICSKGCFISVFLNLLILTGSPSLHFQNQQYYLYLKLYCYFPLRVVCQPLRLKRYQWFELFQDGLILYH